MLQLIWCKCYKIKSKGKCFSKDSLKALLSKGLAPKQELLLPSFFPLYNPKASNKELYLQTVNLKNAPVLLADRIILLLDMCSVLGTPVDPEVCNSTVELLSVHFLRN